MKSQNILKIIILLVIAVGITNFVFAEGSSLDKAQQGLSTAQSGISLLQGGLKTITNTLNSFVGGPPWLHGLVGGAVSAYTTYNDLDDTTRLEKTKDSVNISQTKRDFYDNDIDNLKLIVDSKCKDNKNCSLVLTDQNVLDVTFIDTNKIQTYINDEKNPNLRVAESTDTVNVLDTNGQKVLGQKRELLFEDEKQTIKDAYEYRILLIEYIRARYDKQPIKVKAGLPRFDQCLFNLGSYCTSNLDKRIDKKVEKEIVENRNISPKVIQKFHLLFNSRVDDESTISNEVLDCASETGYPIGTTGTEVLPRVIYNWAFKSEPAEALAINSLSYKNDTWCDVSKNGVYCDATQFTIEALQKINEINRFVENNDSNFTCPVAVATQDLISDINNVGISYLNVKEISAEKAKIDFKIRGNYQSTNLTAENALFDINYTVAKKAENSFNWVTVAKGKIKTVPSSYLNSGGNLSEEFTTPKFTEDIKPTDTVKVILTLTNFNTVIANYETGNNLLDNTLEIQTGLDNATIGCSLEKTTENLKKYDSSFSEELYNFKVYLMKDGYSEDFKKDFDDYYRFTFDASNQTPNWYKTDGVDSYGPLYKYFTNQEKFKYTIRNIRTEIGKTVPGPGKYDVKLMIYYDDNWKLFNNAGDMTGRIEVILEKKQNPELDSAIYYMPLDGMVGSTGEKKRNGYGVDYLNDRVPILLTSPDNYASSMYTDGYISSGTVSTIDTKEIKDFAVMNNGNDRGKLLSITRVDNKLNLKYIPSRPTPVVLKVSNTKVNTDAYAFYKLSVGLPIEEGGAIGNPGLNLVNWTGFSQCNDFTGAPLLERFLGADDIVSVNSELGPITQSQTHTYGVEWTKDTITRTGNVWLYGIFYTPSNFSTGTSTSYLYMDSQNDNANFYKCDSGSRYSKTVDTSVACTLARGRPNANTSEFAKIPLTNIYDKDIQSIGYIFDLVAKKKACVNYDGTTLEVFYNPKSISQPLTNAIDAQITKSTQPLDEFSCIKN